VKLIWFVLVAFISLVEISPAYGELSLRALKRFVVEAKLKKASQRLCEHRKRTCARNPRLASCSKKSIRKVCPAKPKRAPNASPSPKPSASPLPVAPDPRDNEPVVPPQVPPLTLPQIPELALWESHMTQYGRIHCAGLSDPRKTSDEKLAATYYDAQWVYYQIGDYTKDGTWHSCAEEARAIYRDRYVLPNNGAVPGYWDFTHGLLQDYLRTGNTVSRDTVVLLSTRAAYTLDSTPAAWTSDSTLSREVAYAIMAYLNAEDAGAARRARLALLVDQALGHIDQWCVSGTAPYVRPFMVGLTAHALMMYYEKTSDPRVIRALASALDWIWDHTWDETGGAFRYTDRLLNPGDLDPAPDLNLLIAPAYAWMYRQTAQARFLERGDKAFAGGVKRAFLGNAKQFNQNYRLSFEFVRLRNPTP
jgi:hypothetical protein